MNSRTTPHTQLPHSEWPLVRLADVCDIQLGKMLSPASKQGIRSRKYLRNANVQWGRFDLDDIAEMDFTEEQETKFSLGDGDVMVCEGGEPGRAAVWHAEIEDCLYQKSLHRLRPHSEALDSDFLAHRLRFGALCSEFTGSHAKTTIAHLPAVRLAELRIGLPPLREQQHIVDVLREQLDAAARLRAAAAQQGDLADTLVESELRAAYHGIIPLAVSETQDRAPAGWQWQLLTDLARLESGHTPSRRHPEWWGGDIPWLALPDIRELDCRVAHQTIEATNELGIANSSARVLPADTVVLSRTASVGFVAIMGRPMATSQDFVNWVCGPDLNPTFLMYLLRASRTLIRQLSSGAIHKTVYVPTVKAFRVCAPPVADQSRISEELHNRLTALGSIRQLLARQLADADCLPEAFLSYAFSGGL